MARKQSVTADVWLGGEPYKCVHSAKTEKQALNSRKVKDLLKSGHKLIIAQHPFKHKWDVFQRVGA